MKQFSIVLMLVSLLLGCGKAPETAPAGQQAVGQSAVQDDVSEKNIVKVAAGSPDHTTLVAAVTAASLVDALSNAGPFTVFAPVNAAFDKLPKGTVEDLLKPENKDKLKTILYHHVTTSALGLEAFADGQILSMVDGTPVTFTRQGEDVLIDGHKVLGSVKASNGMVHVIDTVLLPPAK